MVQLLQDNVGKRWMCYALFWQIEAHIYEGVDVGMCLSIKIALPMKEYVAIQYHELCREAQHLFSCRARASPQGR